MRFVLLLFSCVLLVLAGSISADTRPTAVPIPSPTPAQVIAASARPLPAEAPPSAWQRADRAGCCQQAEHHKACRCAGKPTVGRK